jgi:hypothetical protein
LRKHGRDRDAGKIAGLRVTAGAGEVVVGDALRVEDGASTRVTRTAASPQRLPSSNPSPPRTSSGSPTCSRSPLSLAAEPDLTALGLQPFEAVLLADEVEPQLRPARGREAKCIEVGARRVRPRPCVHAKAKEITSARGASAASAWTRCANTSPSAGTRRLIAHRDAGTSGRTEWAISAALGLSVRTAYAPCLTAKSLPGSAGRRLACIAAPITVCVDVYDCRVANPVGVQESHVASGRSRRAASACKRLGGHVFGAVGALKVSAVRIERGLSRPIRRFRPAWHAFSSTTLGHDPPGASSSQGQGLDKMTLIW